MTYKIPEGTQTGTTFRIRNRGITEVGGRGRGDYVLTVVVETPKNLSAKQKELLRELENLNEKQRKRKSFFDKLRQIKHPPKFSGGCFYRLTMLTDGLFRPKRPPTAGCPVKPLIHYFQRFSSVVFRFPSGFRL